MEERNSLGHFIRTCRAGLKYTSRKVAALSAARPDLPTISGSYLVAVEKGNHIPRLDKVITLAEVLNVPIHHFVERCRRDIGVQTEAPAETSFEDLLESAREHRSVGDYQQALSRFKHAYMALDQDGVGLEPEQRRQLTLELRLEVASCYRQLHNPRVAREELEALLRDKPVDLVLRTRALFNLAEVLRDMGDLLPAMACAEKALDFARESNDSVLEAKVLFSLANIEVQEQQIEAASRHYREAVKLFSRAGRPRLAAVARLHVAIAAIEAREFVQAIDSLRRLVEGFGEMGDRHHLAWTEFALAKALFLSGDHKACKSHARTAKELAEQAELHDLTFISLYYLWRTALRERQRKMAAVYEERLRYFLNRLDVKPTEAEDFEQRARSQEQAS